MNKVELSLLRNNKEIYGIEGVLDNGDLEIFYVASQYNISGHNTLDNIISHIIPRVPVNIFEVQKRLKRFIDDRGKLVPDEEYKIVIKIYNKK